MYACVYFVLLRATDYWAANLYLWDIVMHGASSLYLGEVSETARQRTTALHCTFISTSSKTRLIKKGAMKNKNRVQQ